LAHNAVIAAIEGLCRHSSPLVDHFHQQRENNKKTTRGNHIVLIRGLLLILAGLVLVTVLWVTAPSATTGEPQQLPVGEVAAVSAPAMAAAAPQGDPAVAVVNSLDVAEDLRDSYCLWPDDTLGDIAAAAGVTVDAILAANPDFTGYAGSAIFLPEGSIPPDQWTTPRPVVPTIAELPFGVSGYYISYDNRERRIALSFDIGYVPENHEFMRWLAEQGIRATFLVMGDPISRYPEVVDHILDNGHELGNHSYTHDNMLTHSHSDIRGELNLTEKVVQQARAGATTKPLFRAPFGAISPAMVQIANEEGYEVVGWTIDSLDWHDNITAEKIYTHVIKNICPGAIIALHDINPASAVALPRIIEHLQRKGYRFVTLSEIIFPPVGG
jgi:peptidoglycan/xylan/chitin deacetylase (PgdA/CDA1 family)